MMGVITSTQPHNQEGESHHNCRDHSDRHSHTIPTSMKPLYQPEDADQAIVQTPYGRGLVIRTRKADNIKEVQLLEWESFANPNGARQTHPFMLYTDRDYPSVPPRVGDDVVCLYGRGRVTGIAGVPNNNESNSKTSNLKYSITLSSWRMNGRSDVTCQVTYPPPRVVRKHILSEMDAHQKVELALSQKLKATHYFQKKDYNLALTTFASAVDAVRNVQHDHTSTNEVRADLVVVMVTCSNNAATCCIKLEKWDEASKFAKNALILLDALYGKKRMKIHTILNKEGTIDARLFGEWRVKSYLVVSRSCMAQGEDEDTIAVLKKAKAIAMEYIDHINAKEETDVSTEEKASLKGLTSQMKEVRRLLVECSGRMKSTKEKEKKRAKAMFGSSSNKEQAIEKKKEVEEDPKQTIPPPKENGETGAAISSDSTAKDVPQENGADVVPETPYNLPFVRKSSLNNKHRDRSIKKTVSFSRRPPQVKEYEKTNNNDDEDSPWYAEHKEAIVMMAVAGLSVVTFMGLRKVYR